MTYSEEALIFSKIPLIDQIRLEDRVSYLYLEHCQIVQTRTGVTALSTQDNEFQRSSISIPVAGLAVMVLGPGTSVTQAALSSCSRAGLTVIFSGGGGIPYYTHATALTSSSRWAIAQAKLIANEKNTRNAAKILYRKQLGIEVNTELTISQMRGLEGSLIKRRYRELAKKHNISQFRRNSNGKDPVNQSINLVNGIIYGCAASACAALDVNPALGIIHRGNTRSLLFDLADVYKPNIALPIAFRSATEEDPSQFARKEMRKFLHGKHILEEMLKLLMELFHPYLPQINDDRLIGNEDEKDAPGHTDYSGTGLS